MISKRQFTSQGSAAKYFAEELSASDYYASKVGVFSGKGIERLGMIEREATPEKFAALESKRHPVTGELLAVRDKTTRRDGNEEVSNKRSGLDITFVVPKTVSLYLAFNPEKANAIERMIHESWKETMTEVEQLAATRVRKDGQDCDRETGELAYLGVVHRDARPEAEVPDPYFHIHTFIFNMTYDRTEQRWKALQSAEIVKNLDMLDAAFLARLEARLTTVGIGTQRTADNRSFELTAVSKEGKDLFSKRSKRIIQEEQAKAGQIERAAAAIVRDARKKGKTLELEKVRMQQRDRVKKLSRHGKRKIDAAEKLEALRSQMTPEIRASLQHEAVTGAARKDWMTPDAGKVAVVADLFANESVVSEAKIAEGLLRRCGGVVSVAEARAWAKSERFVDLDDGMLTTPEVQAEEKEMRDIARDGWDKCQPIGKGKAWEILSTAVASSAEQSAAVRYCLESRDLVMDINGIAGAGKSTLLKELEMAAASRGRLMFTFAPTTKATDVLKAKGFQAATFQSFQYDKRQQAMAVGGIVVVDESSFLSTPQMLWIERYCVKNGCRLILSGDGDQHHGVERGDALRILEDSGSVRFFQLTESHRQHDPRLKAAVESLKAGKSEDGFKQLDRLGAVTEEPDPDKLRKAAMEKHLAVARTGEVSLLACPIHKEADAMAAAVKAQLQADGKISTETHEVTRIRKLQANIKDPVSYETGRVVKFRTMVKGGFLPGQEWRVIDREGEKVELELDGVTRTLQTNTKGSWDVFEAETIQISVGDQMRATANFKHGADQFTNNEIFRVAAIDPENIKCADGRTMKRKNAQLDQGVCVTSHASQGDTVRQVVAVMPMNTFAQADAKALYVLASRATHEVHVFTDCKPAFKEAVLRPGTRTSVYDREIAMAKKMAKAQIVGMKPTPITLWQLSKLHRPDPQMER